MYGNTSLCSHLDLIKRPTNHCQNQKLLVGTMLFVPHICSILNNLCPNLKTDVMTCIGSAEKKQRDSLDRFLNLQEHKNKR